MIRHHLIYTLRMRAYTLYVMCGIRLHSFEIEHFVCNSVWKIICACGYLLPIFWLFCFFLCVSVLNHSKNSANLYTMVKFVVRQQPPLQHIFIELCMHNKFREHQPDLSHLFGFLFCSAQCRKMANNSHSAQNKNVSRQAFKPANNW